MDIHLACPSCAGPFVVDATLIGQSAPCPHCAKTIKLAAPKPPRQPAPSPIVIKGNLVTIGEQHFQMSQINSVRVVPGRFRPIAFMMVLLFGLLTMLTAAMWASVTRDTFSGTLLCFYVPTLALALWRFVDGLRRCKLVLVTSNGEVAALESTNRRRLDSVAADLLGAISAR